MAHYAHVIGGVVVNVIVAEQDYIDHLPIGGQQKYVQTSYNTQAGVHLLGGTPLRKNFAGIGYTYDEERDAFIPSKPFPSWSLDETSCTWKAPTPPPIVEGKVFAWDEPSLSWVEKTAEPAA